MAAGEVIVAVSGIVVSGVLGPWLTLRAHRNSDRKSFNRARFQAQRDELRSVLDDAAVLLSAGPRLLRRQAAESSDPDAQRDALEWSRQVFPMRERLALRLPAEHEVVMTYDRVRQVAQALARTPLDEQTLTAYESARDEFLDAARATLDAAIPEEQR